MRATERCLEICDIFDRLTEDELRPMATGLGLAFQHGHVVSPDVILAVGLALFSKGIRHADMGEPFLTAVRTATEIARAATSRAERPGNVSPLNVRRTSARS